MEVSQWKSLGSAVKSFGIYQRIEVYCSWLWRTNRSNSKHGKSMLMGRNKVWMFGRTEAGIRRKCPQYLPLRNGFNNSTQFPDMQRYGKIYSSASKWACFYSRTVRTIPAAKSLQSCPTLCDPRDGSPPGSPVPGILQARTLEWVAISFSNAGK